MPTQLRWLPRRKPPAVATEIERYDETSLRRNAKAQYALPPFHFLNHLMVHRPNGESEVLAVVERERLLSLPDECTAAAVPSSWESSRPQEAYGVRCRLRGNAMECSGLTWMKGHVAAKRELLSRAPTPEEFYDDVAKLHLRSSSGTVPLRAHPRNLTPEQQLR